MKCQNCGYEFNGLLTTPRGKVCPSCYALKAEHMAEPEPDSIGWYGAGFAIGKGEEKIAAWIPPVGDSAAWQEWLSGFGHAHADYPDEEATEGILEGDFTRGESLDNMLFRILKFPLYEAVKGEIAVFLKI